MLVDEIHPLLPPSAQVQTGAEQAKASAKDISEFTRFIQYFLLSFGAVALFVGAFVIFNTLSITIAQRTRELATLRTLGASRRQVRRSVLIEGFAIGLLASLLGLALGVGLAKGLGALMAAMSLDLPKAGTVFEARTVVVSIAPRRDRDDARQHRSGDQGDESAADRGRPRGRHAAFRRLARFRTAVATRPDRSLACTARPRAVRPRGSVRGRVCCPSRWA